MEKGSLVYIYILIAFVLSNIPLLNSYIKVNGRISKALHSIGMSVAIANTMIHESSMPLCPS